MIRATGIRSGGRPAVFLLVVLPILWGGMLAAAVGLVALLARATDTTLATVPDGAAIVVACCGALLAVPVALMLSNLVLRALSPLRRIASRDAARHRRPDFAASQRALLRLFLVLAAICAPIIAATFALAR